ncbi:MAG: transporter permease [Acidimicrobiaceae bacterium]|nr:transporter permease [Acidimicrobiaceae bacterium]
MSASSAFPVLAPGGTASDAGGPARAASRLASARVTVPLLALCLVPGIWALVASSNAFGTAVVSPLATVKEIHSQWSVLWLNAQPTLYATLIGVAVLLGITALGALVVAMVPRITPALAALSVVVGTLPLIVLTPILSLFIARGRPLVATVCVLAGLVPVAAMLSGMARVGERGRDELGALYGTSRLRWWRFVGFWQTVPVLDIGIRAMIPYCFVGSIVAEWSGASSSFGLGEVMTNALFSYEPPLLWATITLAAVGSLALLAVASVAMYPFRRMVR